MLFISFTDTNDQYDVRHMIFYEKNIYPDLTWLSKEDIEIYKEAYKRS